MRPYCSPEGRGTRTAGCTVALPASSLASPTSQMWSASKSKNGFFLSFLSFTARCQNIHTGIAMNLLTVDNLTPLQAAGAVERYGEGRRLEHGGLPAEVQLAHPEGDGRDEEDGQEGGGDDEEG